MRNVRFETKITDEGRKDLNYLAYIYGIKHDNRLIEKLAQDARIREMKKRGSSDGME